LRIGTIAGWLSPFSSFSSFAKAAENSRPVLFGDRRSMPLAQGLAILTASLPALFEDTLNDPPRHLHAEISHGSAVGKREDVGRLQRLVRAIHERLTDGHLR
jgi:hypothetical protein